LFALLGLVALSHADLDRMAFFGRVHRVRHRCALRPRLRQRRRIARRRAAAPQRAEHPADHEQHHRDRRLQPGAGARTRAALPHRLHQALGHRLVRHGCEARAQRVAVGRPQPHARRVFGVLLQPGLHACAVGALDLTVEPGRQQRVIGTFGLAVHRRLQPPIHTARPLI
jgi:hypothetical protein